MDEQPLCAPSNPSTKRPRPGDDDNPSQSGVLIRAGKRAAWLTESERCAMFIKSSESRPSFLLTAMDTDERVVELPILSTLSEDGWRVLFSFDPTQISDSELMELYKASLYIEKDAPGLRSLLQYRFERCSTWSDFMALVNVWKIGVEQKALPPVVTPNPTTNLFPGNVLHDPSLPLFDPSHFTALVARLANVTAANRGTLKASFSTFYREFVASSVEIQVAFFNVFHAFACRYHRNSGRSFLAAQVVTFDLYGYQPYRAQIAYPGYSGKSTDRNVYGDVRAALPVAGYPSAPETGPVPFTVFKERFDKATAGLFNDPAMIEEFKNERFCALSGGTVAACLSSNYSEQSMVGKDVDIFVAMRCGAVTRGRFFESFYQFYKKTTNNQAFHIQRRGNILEFVCPQKPLFQFILLDDFDATRSLHRFDIASRMVAYNGQTVRATYDGLQAWYTHEDVYAPVGRFRQSRFDKFRQSGFKLFASQTVDYQAGNEPVATPVDLPVKVYESSFLERDDRARRRLFSMLELDHTASGQYANLKVPRFPPWYSHTRH